MRPTRCAAFFLAWTFLAPLARGAEPPHASPPTAAQLQTARDLFAEAAEDEDAQRWSDALEKLHRVAEVKLTASVRYHSAFCEEKLGQSATALVHYTEARDAAVREHNKDVQDLLKPPFLSDLQARVPTLMLEVPPDATGAAVTIDGQTQPQATWGTAQPFDPGRHRIEAHAPGRVSFARDLILHEREITVLDVSLPIAALATATPVAPPLASSEGARPPVDSPTAPATASASPHSRTASRPLGAAIATTAGAALLVGVGIGAFVVAGNKQSDGEATCLTRTTSCDDLRGPVRTWDGVALGAWIGAAALATTAVILWVAPAHGASANGSGSLKVTTTGSTLRFEGTF